MVHFMEEDTHIVYLPSLNMSGYGDTIEEAQELLNTSVGTYFKDLIRLPHYAIFKELQKYGWQRDSIFKKKMKNLSNTTYEDIKKQFNIPDDVQLNESVLEV